MSPPGEPPYRLGDRFRLVRVELFGHEGVAELAMRLNVPVQVWKNYEEVGELASAPVLRAFVELTGVNPLWLLQGHGPRYRPGREPDGRGTL